MSISFPVGSSTSLKDKYSKLPDAFQVSPQRKMMINPSTRQVSPLSSGPTGASGNCYPSSSRFPNPVQAPSASPHERRPQNSSPFVPQSTVGRPSYMESQSAAFIDPMEDNKEISWGQDSLQDLLDFPVMEPIQSVPVEDSRLALAPVNHPEKSVWTEWDPLISIEGDLDQYWPDLPVTSSNGNAIVSKPEGTTQSINAVAQQPPQNYQHQPAQSGEFSSGPDPSSAAAPTKSRMRWTQELHEAFVESVSKLGGCERATPKGILTLMKVSGLTIYHVKSHLQKYRTARFKPELSEGNSETKSTLYEEVKSEEVKTSIGITEALRLQVELQKRLHEQLETQRKLQLQIEEQGKYLQKMFEQHKTMGNKFNNKADGHEREPSSPSSDSVHKSSQNGKTVHPKTGIDATIAPNESSRDVTTKHKAQESDTSDSDSPATKRARSG